jgi:hypothetical protein
MIAGIVLLALGVKKAIAHAYDPLDTVPPSPSARRGALLLRPHRLPLRNVHSWAASASRRPSLPGADPAGDPGRRADRAGRGGGGRVALIAYEAVHFREARERIRAGGLPESMMAEQES